MAKLLRDQITASHVAHYAEHLSDFGFELKVGEVLKVCNLIDIEHGGTYRDPITQLPREFDYRAKSCGPNDEISFAIECKNIGHHYPLIVECVQRRPFESYVDVIRRPKSSPSPHSRFYTTASFVGKSTCQLGRIAPTVAGSLSRDNFVTGDKEIYESWTQAIHSSYDLIRDAADGDVSPEKALVFPMVVVPDGTLWVIKRDIDGQLMTAPKTVDSCSYYVGHPVSVMCKRYADIPYHFSISHLEFVTIGGLKAFFEECYTDVSHLRFDG